MPKENITRGHQARHRQGRRHGKFEEITLRGLRRRRRGHDRAKCSPTTATARPARCARSSKNADGKLGGAGSVAWMFERKGLFMVSAAKVNEDKLMEIALEAGADNVKQDGDKFAITCDLAPTAGREALEQGRHRARGPGDHADPQGHRERQRPRHGPPDPQADGEARRPRRRAERCLPTSTFPTP